MSVTGARPVPPWLPMETLPDTDEVVQIKLQAPGKEVIAGPVLASEWQGRGAFPVVTGPAEVEHLTVAGWRPMTPELWAIAPDTPEAVNLRATKRMARVSEIREAVSKMTTSEVVEWIARLEGVAKRVPV